VIHPETHTVTAENGPRPAGKPDECFYCKKKIGELHKLDCVVRQKTVVVRATIEYTIVVPEHWDKDSIEFHRNTGSWCSSNAIGELYRIGVVEDSCMCSQISFEYVREATAGDELRDKTRIEL
jgi:hypothetical protein